MVEQPLSLMPVDALMRGVMTARPVIFKFPLDTLEVGVKMKDTRSLSPAPR